MKGVERTWKKHSWHDAIIQRQLNFNSKFLLNLIRFGKKKLTECIPKFDSSPFFSSVASHYHGRCETFIASFRIVHDIAW